MKRYFIFHGHFYQPPRECPWLGMIEQQPGAHPFHDWNERIARECYAPHGCSRILSPEGRVIQLSNNYCWMSFNFGPTLLNWMQKSAPECLKPIIVADHLSVERCGGHGNAIAQAYNHMIMPLAGARDKRTQVLWGVADFIHRFGRVPEGMHLPEMAVDIATLEALAEAGIKFTLLAPQQARRWRPIAESDWRQGEIDTSRAYVCRLPSGRAISLFFYDGSLAHAVAFGGALTNGEGLCNRVRSAFDKLSRNESPLVHIGVDGETAGHHVPFGDMCLAWLFKELAADKNIAVTNYGQYLELHPASWEVEIREPSSWSCSHGVERWRSNCGCRFEAGTSQEWRRPLRESLDKLRGDLDRIFEQSGARLFRDLWQARDEYIQVLLNRESADEFVRQHLSCKRTERSVKRAFALLEMQRFAMFMYTSCGWFFDELSRVEPVQNLRYAARAIMLAARFTPQDLESSFVADLAKAPSNDKGLGTGRAVWERHVVPGMLDRETRSLLAEPSLRAEDVRRVRKLLSRAQALSVGADIWDVQNDILRQYASSKRAGSLTQKAEAAYRGLACQAGLAAEVLGWEPGASAAK